MKKRIKIFNNIQGFSLIELLISSSMVVSGIGASTFVYKKISQNQQNITKKAELAVNLQNLDTYMKQNLTGILQASSSCIELQNCINLEGKNCDTTLPNKKDCILTNSEGNIIAGNKNNPKKIKENGDICNANEPQELCFLEIIGYFAKEKETNLLAIWYETQKTNKNNVETKISTDNKRLNGSSELASKISFSNIPKAICEAGNVFAGYDTDSKPKCLVPSTQLCPSGHLMELNSINNTFICKQINKCSTGQVFKGFDQSTSNYLCELRFPKRCANNEVLIGIGTETVENSNLCASNVSNGMPGKFICSIDSTGKPEYGTIDFKCPAVTLLSPTNRTCYMWVCGKQTNQSFNLVIGAQGVTGGTGPRGTNGVFN